MKEKLLQKVAEYKNIHRKQMWWYRIVTSLAAVVVFCTVYSLILPAITMENGNVNTSSNGSVATSSNALGDPSGIMNVHTPSNLLALTDEELLLVQQAKQLLDELPDSETVETTLDEYEQNADKESFNAYLSEIQNQVTEAKETYETLNEKQKPYITNLNKIHDLDWIWEVVYDFAYPVLEDDSAYVSELDADGIEVIKGVHDTEEEESENDESVDGKHIVRNGDTVLYQFQVKTATYEEERFSQGRVKLEFVLPFTDEQAEFDLDSMEWLDTSDGYAADITTETRTVKEKAVVCQVLTGYYNMKAESGDISVIPGTFEEHAAVTVLDMDSEETLSIQISAAMEFSAWDDKLTVSTDKVKIINLLTAEQQKAFYLGYVAEIETLEALESLSDEDYNAAEALLVRIQESYEKGELNEAYYTELVDRISKIMEGFYNCVAERAEGVNWIALRDSGWFEEYAEYENYDENEEAVVPRRAMLRNVKKAAPFDLDGDTSQVPASAQQIKNVGGSTTSDDGTVTVSKTIAGTDLENVFDITLQVQTTHEISEFYEEPDMAVVVVMDISNTMKSNFGGSTRYNAAMLAADQFLEQFAASNTLGISKVGYVAFNTDAHKIFDLQSCMNGTQANTLKNTMRTETGKIINAAGYEESHSRFTNVEAGLKMASDMLSRVNNKNKYIIFLSDGFPTTYVKNEYAGYDPYTSSGTVGNKGVFFDQVTKKYCTYGTSYSDKAAILARKYATDIKESGVTIFSIGVDVGGQTVQGYVDQTVGKNFSVVDRTSTTYEIGDASSAQAYKNWLKNSIGSGYYYDSTNTAGLKDAYDKIFAQIKRLNEESSLADWVANDPMPKIQGAEKAVEFIGFYNKTPKLVSGNLEGTYAPDGENTASFNKEETKIHWDLKNSGYQKITSGNTSKYTYQLVYRVRLKNENTDFIERQIYKTNDPTSLTYRTIETNDGIKKVSGQKTVDFPIPAVEGYLSELTFKKIDSFGAAVKDAEFTLSHDVAHCAICKGNGTPVTSIPDFVKISDENGNVTFERIPSGHKYTLTETKVPAGYSANGDTYSVEVAYDTLTVTVKDLNGNPKTWNNQIVNNTYYELPATGGSGTILYTIVGILMMTGAAFLLGVEWKKVSSARSQ